MLEVEIYIDEIRDILAKVNVSFQNEQQYNYDLLQMYNGIESEFKSIELRGATHEQITSMYEEAKSLLKY
ncbi:hypothetical protein [Bacillus mycoides]|uniref:hypothetical protein n=1 Tax=Bacillus mycoides TaxID=1405 RepID=UPI0011A8DEE1|nr:hypothetical protein [Bacillus mycoides]